MVGLDEQVVTKPRRHSGTEGTGRNLNRSFQVFIRLSPQEQRDCQTGDEARSFIRVKGPNQVVVDTGRGHLPQTLEFSAVWDETATQRDVYDSTAKPLVEALLQGYNGCVITYGSPAGGNSLGLLGGGTAGAQRGIVGQAVEDIFNSPEARNCKIRVSFIQIADEKIYDLLEIQSAEVCRIREGEGPVLLDGVKEVEVGSPQAMLRLYRRGAGNRHSGVSRGECAGRSHVIFNITVVKQMPKVSDGQEGLVTTSKLTLVDLACSAKVSPHCGPIPEVRRTFQVAQENHQEAKMLKRSLAIFGNVIFALGTAGREHVPYRESKLTGILRDCLGGNCRTSLIVTVSPKPSSVTETISSLQFACRAMAVPGRQLRCSPLRVNSAKAADKPKSSHCKQQTQLTSSTVKRVHPQTCLPPIRRAPVPPSRHGPKRSDEPDHKAFLPQLEAGGTPALRPAKATSPAEERAGVVAASRPPRLRSRSGTLPVNRVAELSDRERQPRPETLHSPRISRECFPPPLTPTAAAPLVSADCPDRKRERTIRQEYDRYIVRARGDRDALGQRVAELEARLQRKNPGAPAGPASAAGPQIEETAGVIEGVDNPGQRGAPVRPEHTEGSENLQREVEVLQAQVRGHAKREEVLAHQLQVHTDRAALEAHGLKARAERDRLQLRSLECQKESLSVELEDTRVKYARFEEEVALTVAELQKQKDELLSQIGEKEKHYVEVALENADLKERVDAVLGEVGSAAPSSLRGPHGHPHTLTTSTDLSVVSHHVSRGCSKDYCFHSGVSVTREPAATSHSDCSHLASQELFRQLRREHSLLRDVMLILYRRRWFVDDAMPYVWRTLRKCGAKLDPLD